MTKRSSGPTVFLPMPPRRRDPLAGRIDTSFAAAEPTTPTAYNVTLHDADFWEEDFATYDQSNALTAPLPPKTKTVRRSRVGRETVPQATVANGHANTIFSYLHSSFLGEPVCVLTQAGRFRGKLVNVSPHDLALLTDQGPIRYLALDGLLSVGYDRSATSCQTFKNA